MSHASKGSFVASKARAKWLKDPIAFARDVLGVKLWRGQRQIVQSILSNDRVAVRSGHKCGKSTALAVAALWYAVMHDRARVVFTAASNRQVKGVIWKEIVRLYRRAKFPLGGDLHESPDSGLQFKSGAEIVGFATKETERMAGFSGPRMLFLIDEASGVEDEIFEAMVGNSAGGAKVIATSNPTKTHGWFYEAFASNRSKWDQIHISSIDCANESVIELGEKPKGLATIQWCNDLIEEWGKDDPRTQIRVFGEFPTQGNDCLIPITIVEHARDRWSNTPCVGQLTVGLDVARFGEDLTSITWSRGKWASKPVTMSKVDSPEVVGRVIALIKEIRLTPNERVEVRVDTSGLGGPVAGFLRSLSDEFIDVVEINSSDASTTDGCERMRDQLWLSLKDWLKQGGSIPNDDSLIRDIATPKYSFGPRGDLKVESKLDMRKRIGRSTDRADSLALAVYHGIDENSGYAVADKASERDYYDSRN